MYKKNEKKTKKYLTQKNIERNLLELLIAFCIAIISCILNIFVFKIFSGSIFFTILVGTIIVIFILILSDGLANKIVTLLLLLILGTFWGLLLSQVVIFLFA